MYQRKTGLLEDFGIFGSYRGAPCDSLARVTGSGQLQPSGRLARAANHWVASVHWALLRSSV